MNKGKRTENQRLMGLPGSCGRIAALVVVLCAFAAVFTACNNPTGNNRRAEITITVQPNSTLVTFGEITGSLSVTVDVTEDATPAFQWQQQSGDDWEDVGEDSDTFPIPANLAVGEHIFRVVISADRRATAVTSDEITVTVIEAPEEPPVEIPVVETRGVTVNVTGTGAGGVTHNAPDTILQSATQLAVTLSGAPAGATVTAADATVAGNVVTFTFAAGASALTFAITVTAATVDTPTVTLTPASVTIADSNLTASVGVTGTATGDVTLNTTALPSGVSATVSGETITVTGVRQATAINGTFSVGVTRQGITQNLSVAVNLTALTVTLTPASVTINDDNLTANVNVTGTATGAVTLTTATLPVGVTATVSGTTITVTGVRQVTAINDTFTVGVIRQGVTQNLSVVVNLTAVPTVILTPSSVTINISGYTLTQSVPVTVTGTATGDVTIDTTSLPTGVTATVSETTITVTGTRQPMPIDNTFTVSVTRQGITQNLSVTVNLPSNLPTVPGLFFGAPETLTPSSTRIAQITGNNLTSVITAMNNGAAGAYTLLLDAGVTNATQQTLGAGRQLTIIGIGGAESTIQYTGAANQRLFNLNNSTVSLTIWNNITLRGIDNSTSNVVNVQSNAQFTMRDGSRITGHITASQEGAVVVQTGGRFTMEGGEITGNISTFSLFNFATGGVRIQNTGFFTMTGGRIYGNFRVASISADVTRQLNTPDTSINIAPGIRAGTPANPINLAPGEPGIGVLHRQL